MNVNHDRINSCTNNYNVLKKLFSFVFKYFISNFSVGIRVEIKSEKI